MKENTLVLLFLSLQFSPTLLKDPLAILNKVSSKVGYTNSALGMISRSKNVNAASELLRHEDSAKVRESLAQAVATLVALDIGGGALVPITQHIIETITKNTAFKATRDAWGVYRTGLESTFKEQFKTLSESAVKRLLNSKKAEVLRAFETDVGKIQNVPKYSKTMKYINKAKRWFRVKSAAKILGPLFDTIGIGINSWALETAIADCNENPATCNKGAIASASLGIVSGVVGVGVFVATLVVSSSVSAVLGPVGALVSFTLAICATLIELFYKPPINEEEVRYQKRIQMLQELDGYSRRQLYIANKFMADNDINRGDLYVVNQGQLPKWIDTRKNLQFGTDFMENPRKIKNHIGVCEHQFNTRTPGIIYRPIRPMTKKCPLLVDGTNIKSRSDDFSDYVGYGFYGFTSNGRSIQKTDSFKPEKPYDGSIVLVNTDEVQKSKFSTDEDLDKPLRSMYIDTERKGLDGNYDDVVAIGNMKNLDSSAKVAIRTGGGNDVLNIDGFIGETKNQLDADLGPGYNMLSFLGMPDNEDSEIQGIEFDAENQDGRLTYYIGPSLISQSFVGFVKQVSVLGASPFTDTVKLFAHKEAENGDDFTVIKFKGKAKYHINVDRAATLSSHLYEANPFTPHFKIIDTTDNGQNGENKCDNHKPLLSLSDFDLPSAVANDILYDGNHIKIYGKDRYERKRDANGTAGDSDMSPLKRRCSGEPDDGSHPKGGEDGKRLLVTVSFHTKCPGEVEASNNHGGCMMKRRMVSELDFLFFNGDNLVTDFTQNVQSSQPNNPKIDDVCTLKCPQQRVSHSTQIDLGKGENYLVIKNELFLDPCGIDGEVADMILKKKDEGTWELEFRGEHEKFTGDGKKHQLKGVKWIANEYGQKIVNLKRFRKDKINLFDRYTRKTVIDIGDRVRRLQTDEAADTLTQCLQNQSTDELANICKLGD